MFICVHESVWYGGMCMCGLACDQAHLHMFWGRSKCLHNLNVKIVTLFLSVFCFFSLLNLKVNFLNTF